MNVISRGSQVLYRERNCPLTTELRPPQSGGNVAFTSAKEIIEYAVNILDGMSHGWVEPLAWGRVNGEYIDMFAFMTKDQDGYHISYINEGCEDSAFRDEYPNIRSRYGYDNWKEGLYMELNTRRDNFREVRRNLKSFSEYPKADLIDRIVKATFR